MTQRHNDTFTAQLAEVEVKQEVQRLRKTFGCHGVAQQQNQHDEQQWHQNPDGILKPFVHTTSNDVGRHDHKDGVIYRQHHRVSQQFIKHSTGFVAIGAIKGTRGHFTNVFQRPACDNAVERQNKEASQCAHPTNYAEELRCFVFVSHRLQCVNRAQTCLATNQHLSQHHRNTGGQNTQQIHQYECTTTVLTGNVWEFPDIPQTHSRSGCRQDKSPAVIPDAVHAPFIVIHNFIIRLFG